MSTPPDETHVVGIGNPLLPLLASAEDEIARAESIIASAAVITSFAAESGGTSLFGVVGRMIAAESEISETLPSA